MKFIYEAFPPPVENFIRSVEAGSGTRASYVSLGVLAACNILSAGCKIKMKEGYYINSNMFLGIVGQKGCAKSVAVNLPLKALQKRQTQKRLDYERDYELWKRDLELIPKSKPKEIKSHLEIEPKNPRTYLVTTGTLEGFREELLHNYKSGNPTHIVIVKDELNAFFGDMNAYRGGAGSDQEFYLSIYDGMDIVISQKNQRRTVPNATMSVLGGIQPDIFHSAFDDKKKSNGLFDRFQFSLYEGFPAKTDLDQYICEEAVREYDNFIINRLEDDIPDTIIFPPDLMPQLRDFFDWCYDKAVKVQNGAFKKWETNLAKLLCNLTILWGEVEVTPYILEKAIELQKHYIDSWLRGNNITEKSGYQKTREEFTNFMMAKGAVTSRNMKRKSAFSDSKLMKEIIADMIESGEIELMRKSTGGRPSETYNWVG